jgi:hypothetical protein
MQVPNSIRKRLEHKKRGAREGSPWVWGVLSVFWLENEFNAELELAHADRGTGGGIRLDVRDLTGR